MIMRSNSFKTLIYLSDSTGVGNPTISKKELDFLDSVFTYLVDYYDHSKESKKEVITQSEIDAVIEGLDEEILNRIKDIKNDKNS